MLNAIHTTQAEPQARKRLLVAYDGSASSNQALLGLDRVGLPAGLEAWVLSVADVWNPVEGRLSPEDEAALPDNVRRARDRSRERIEAQGRLAAAAAEQLSRRHPGWSVQPVASTGWPAHTIVQAAREWHAELVVIGSHGHGPIRRFLRGSVSQVVAAHAHCSVHVTPPQSPSSDASLSLAIVVDGSRESARAINAVLGRSWAGEVTVHLLTLLDSTLETAGSGPANRLGEPDGQAAGHGPGELATLAGERLSDREWTVQAHRLEGDPKAVLPEQVKHLGVSCLFVGASRPDHGLGSRVGRAIPALLRRAPCAVEVVR